MKRGKNISIIKEDEEVSKRKETKTSKRADGLKEELINDRVNEL